MKLVNGWRRMSRVARVCLGVFLSTALCAQGADTVGRELKVLMVGNSFSISNCRCMPRICKEMGLKLELGSLYIGGCSLERHWQNVVAATNAAFRPYGYSLYRDGAKVKGAPAKANIPEIVKGTKWDVITIQQASHFSWKAETYRPYADNLLKTFKAWCPGAEIVVQETWSYTPWDGRLKTWGIDADAMYGKLHAAYNDYAKANGLRVIPMGAAVQLWRKRLPVVYTENSFGGDVCGSAKFTQNAGGTWVPKGDVFHLNARGQYFQSLVWTAKLFGADVTACPWRPDFVTEADARLMKATAVAAVRGELP